MANKRHQILCETKVSAPIHYFYLIFLIDYNILYFLLEALNQVKSLYFTSDDVIGYEPFCGMLSIADGSINKIGQLFTASICHGGPGPGFLVPRVFRYIKRGITGVLPSLPKELLLASAISELYKEVMQICSFIEFG